MLLLGSGAPLIHNKNYFSAEVHIQNIPTQDLSEIKLKPARRENAGYEGLGAG